MASAAASVGEETTVWLWPSAAEENRISDSASRHAARVGKEDFGLGSGEWPSGGVAVEDEDRR